MKTKEEIVTNWLVRYTGVPLEEFGAYILLTNFQHYVDIFAALTGAEIQGKQL
jgi:AMP nucleosidase